jgi:hypothetical protein
VGAGKPNPIRKKESLKSGGNSQPPLLIKMDMSAYCGVCLSTRVYPDHDINICLSCGAHEVRGGWQPRLLEKASKGILPLTGEMIDEKVVLPKSEIRSDGTEASNYCVFAWVESERDELSDEVVRRAAIPPENLKKTCSYNNHVGAKKVNQ